jgi:fido (protein-threonine AMPylation protein)
VLIKNLEGVEAIKWVPDSLQTKFTDGFGRASRVDDGSELTVNLIDELATVQGPMLDKVFALYATGVTDYEGKIFSPKQLLSMIVHNNPYKPGDVCRWTGGVRTDDGVVYGPDVDKKIELLGGLCETLDEWDPAHFKQVSDETGLSYEQAVYLVADYAQLTFLLVHPFWNRNGRTSEELMQLFCAQNQARQLVFWNEITTRYTEASATRMVIINRQAQEILSGVLKNLGISADADSAVTDGYKKMFLADQPNLASRLALAIMSPYHYRFISGIFSPQQSEEYFEEIGKELDSMIELLKPESFCILKDNTFANELLQHHLEFGCYRKEI